MQEEVILSETIGRKLYSTKGVMAGTLLGGPLTGAYLLSKNYKALNQPEKVGKTWFFGILIFLFIIVLAIVAKQIPQVLFVVLYAWMGQFAAQKLQGSLLDKHAAEGGSFYSNWKAAGVGLIVSVIFVAIALIAFYLMDVSFVR